MLGGPARNVRQNQFCLNPSPKQETADSEQQAAGSRQRVVAARSSWPCFVPALRHEVSGTKDPAETVLRSAAIDSDGTIINEQVFYFQGQKSSDPDEKFPE
jgi:hypothetical protein